MFLFKSMIFTYYLHYIQPQSDMASALNTDVCNKDNCLIIDDESEAEDN